MRGDRKRDGPRALVLGTWSGLSPGSVRGPRSVVRAPRTWDLGRTRDQRRTKSQVPSTKDQRWLAVFGAIAAAGLTLAAQSQSGRPVHVMLHEGTSMAAAVSPDGRTIAIDLLGTLWTMPASGGAARPITDIFMDARQPSWSPDGTRLTFQAYHSSTWQIWTMKADGTELKAVTSGPYDDREPVWSPDGQRIAFSSDRSGSYDVWVLTLASGDVRQVTSGSSNEFQPAWKGASQLAFVSDRREGPGIYVTDLS